MFKSIETYGLFPQRDVKLEHFQSKFPFKKIDMPRADNKMEMQSQIDFFNELSEEVLKPNNISEIIRRLRKPKKYNYLDELQKLRVVDDNNKIVENVEASNFVSEKIFKVVNDRMLKKQKGATSQKIKALEAHNRALYNSFNDVFTKMIPVGLKENPFPWIVRDQAFRESDTISEKVFTEKDVRQIIKRVKRKLTEIIKIPQTGKDSLNTKLANTDETPAEEYNEKEEKRKKKIMEENLWRVMASEIEEWEKEWVTYEKEKAQVTFDWADIIMEQIAEETIKILEELELKRITKSKPLY